MGSALTTIGLPVALGIIMFGLGLSLTFGDFARVGKHPKAVFIALASQLVLLPLICFGLVLAFNLPPVLALGMMLLSWANIAYYQSLMQGIRAAIAEGRFDAFRTATKEQWKRGDVPA